MKLHRLLVKDLAPAGRGFGEDGGARPLGRGLSLGVARGGGGEDLGQTIDMVLADRAGAIESPAGGFGQSVGGRGHREDGGVDDGRFPFPTEGFQEGALHEQGRKEPRLHGQGAFQSLQRGFGLGQGAAAGGQTDQEVDAAILQGQRRVSSRPCRARIGPGHGAVGRVSSDRRRRRRREIISRRS